MKTKGRSLKFVSREEAFLIRTCDISLLTWQRLETDIVAFSREEAFMRLFPLSSRPVVFILIYAGFEPMALTMRAYTLVNHHITVRSKTQHISPYFSIPNAAIQTEKSTFYINLFTQMIIW